MENTFEPGMNWEIVHHYNHSGKWNRPRSVGVCKTAVLILICGLIVMENILVLLALWRMLSQRSRRGGEVKSDAA